jgi:hypothetical protein
LAGCNYHPPPQKVEITKRKIHGEYKEESWYITGSELENWYVTGSY